MKILSTIRKILLHVCVVCSLVSIISKNLDWYNPYMDFSPDMWEGFRWCYILW